MMKRCPKCGQTFADQNLNFCLNDGELLMYQQEASRPFDDKPLPTQFADDSPPTLMMNSPRDTNPVGWPQGASPSQWQGQQQIVTPPGHMPVQYASYSSPNQVLGILALVLGACSVTIGWCCYTGMLLGPAAMILGAVALFQNKNDPTRYGGKGMALGGIVLGGVYLVGMVLFILLYGAAMIIGPQ
ncbi:MAG: DUF4190 domain-containing protein [Pyrinomonadaceae bacterium]